MTGGLSRLRRLWVYVALPAVFCMVTPPVQGNAQSAAQPVPIILQVSVPNHPSVRYGVDAIQQVVRSEDGGSSWSVVLDPGDAQAPDPSTPGACLPGTYDRVILLAINPLRPKGLYVATDGVLGDYLDNGCGNAPGGLFYSATGEAPFAALNSGLPANADARGGGVAWGIQSITFDPKDKQTLYVQTDPSFLAVQGAGKPTYPTDPGIYRSRDGGTQWDAAFGSIADVPCQFGPCRYPGSLAIDPVHPQVLVFAAPTGLYRTTNHGLTWQLTATFQVGDRTHLLARIDPYQPALVYVATDKALYRSTDGGLHLAQLRAGTSPDPDSIVDISFIHHSPAQVVYVLSNGRRDVRTDSNSLVMPNSVPVNVPPSVAPSSTPPPSATPPPTATARPSATRRARATASPTATVRPKKTPKPSATPRPTATTKPRVTAQPTATLKPRATAKRAATAAATSIIAAASGPDEWPMVGHDTGQSFADPVGSMSARTARRLRLRWVMGGAAPAIEASGTLYALTSDQKVVALDPKSGAVRHRYLSTKVESLAHAGNLVYFNLGSEIRYVDDKTAAWHHTASDKQGSLLNAFSSLVATDRVLYSGVGVQNSGYVGRAYAFDATTGKTLWSIEGNPSSVPCVVGNSVYVSFGSYGNGDTDVMDATTGAVRNVLRNLGTAQWHTSGNRLYASVLHGGGNNLTASVRAYTLGGKLLWVGHDVLFGAALPDRMFGVTATAVDARSAVDGHRLWKHTVPGLHAIAPGSVAIVGKLLLVQAQNGTITLLDSDNGAVLGVLRPPSPASAAGDLIAGDGLVFERITIKAAAGAPAKSELLAFGL